MKTLKKKIFIIVILLFSLVTISVIFTIRKIELNKNITTDGKSSNVTMEYQGLVVTASDLAKNSTSQTDMQNNTARLQNHIDNVSNSGGGVVRIPAGTYYFASAGANVRNVEEYVIKCRDNVVIEGAGTNENDANKYTILKPKGKVSLSQGGIDMFYFNDYIDYSEERYLDNADFKNFIIDGGEVEENKYNSSGKGFMINLFKNCDWENVIVRNTYGTGFGMDCPINSTIKNCKAINCGRGVTSDKDPGGSGFGIGTGYSNDEYIHIENSEAIGNGKFGFFFEHQGRFNAKKYTATESKGFVVSNSKASNNRYDFGGIRANDVTFENCISTSQGTATPIKFGDSSELHDGTRRIHTVNCKVQNEYEDVPSNKWYYDTVHWATNNGITNGTSTTKFEPEATCTRAQAIIFIYRMAERPKNGIYSYKDEKIYDDVNVNNSEHGEEIEWAKNLGIIGNRPNNLFNPTDGCTRAEFITFLWKYAGSEIVNIKNNFTDIDKGTEYEKAVNWGVSKGIVKGTESNLFSPNDICTRAEIVTFLYRYVTSTSKFNITYNLMGGTVASGNKTSYKSGSSFSLNNPTKTGYTFKGWTGSSYSEYTGSNYTAKEFVKISTSDTGNKTYTANWEANSYTISFNANGGVGTMDNEYFTYDAVPQQLLNNTFARTGYSFKNWNTKSDGTGTSYNNSAKIKNLTSINGTTITLYAQWISNSYTIKYDKNSADGTETMTNTTCTYDNNCQLNENKFTKTGYSFKSWNTKSDGTGTSYNNSAEVKNLTSTNGTTITLYAQWTPNSYIINYDNNDADGTETMTNTTCTYDKTCPLNENKFTKTGYSFKNWNTKSDGTGTSYNNSAEVKNLTSTNGTTITLYAQWAPNNYIKLDESLKVNKNNIITNVPAGNKIDYVYNRINTSGTISIFDRNNILVTDRNNIVKTGYKFKVELSNNSIEYILSIKGDTNGDGNINIMDIIDIAKTITNSQRELKEEFYLASDVDENNNINVMDIIKIAKYITNNENF